MPVKMLCTCGEIAFVRGVINNPCPENPTPCREHYLEIIEIRNKVLFEGKKEDED